MFYLDNVHITLVAKAIEKISKNLAHVQFSYLFEIAVYTTIFFKMFYFDYVIFTRYTENNMQTWLEFPNRRNKYKQQPKS